MRVLELRESISTLSNPASPRKILALAASSRDTRARAARSKALRVVTPIRPGRARLRARDPNDLMRGDAEAYECGRLRRSPQH